MLISSAANRPVWCSAVCGPIAPVTDVHFDMSPLSNPSENSTVRLPLTVTLARVVFPARSRAATW